MKVSEFFLPLLVMAGVTYLVRAVPFGLMQKKITSRFLQSFFYYIPYTVLAAMTFPAIFYCTGQMLPSMAGTVTALVLSFRGRGMVTVALASCAAVALLLLIV